MDVRGRITPKFEPISAVAHELHEGYLRIRETRPGACLYIYMIGVRVDLNGRGLGRRLVAEALRNAGAAGYRSAFVLATNMASMGALAHGGFEELARVDYASYRHEGRPVFASILDHPGVALMECAAL